MSKDSLTKRMNNENILSIRNQIQMKKEYHPYYSTMNNTKSVITDMDHFPYTRFYRGIYNSSDPIVFEREAGWRPTRNFCYKGAICTDKDPYPNHCFETACSTVFPCYPQYLTKYADKESLNVQLNNACVAYKR